MGKRKSASWMYMSRLAAQKEWAFMKVRAASSLSCGQSLTVFLSLGLTRTRISRAAADRSVQTHCTDGVYRCLSSVRKLFTPIDLVCKFVTDGWCSRQISEVASAGKLYSTLMDLIIRFARSGLIHGDFNEFNILIRRSTGEPVVIDFPQMVSTSHTNAEWCVSGRGRKDKAGIVD
jgi:RIO kinase 2